MATTGYGARRAPNGRHHPSLIEVSIALSVIVGLLFVGVRVAWMPKPPPPTLDAVVMTSEAPMAPATQADKNP